VTLELHQNYNAAMDFQPTIGVGNATAHGEGTRALQVQSHESGGRTSCAADGGAMLAPVNRSTMPSRSTRQTIASAARGRQWGGRK